MLPEGWKNSTVGRSCAIKNNLRFPINAGDRETQQGPFPYFGPTGRLDSLNSYRIDETFALIGEDGDHFLKFNEREMTLFYEGKANVNNHAHVIGNSDECLAKWFYYSYMHRDLTPVLSRQGVARYKLTKASLEELEILLPPIDEQLAVIQIMEIWDRAVGLLEALLVNSRTQRSALIHDLLLGRVRRSEFVSNSGIMAEPLGSPPQDWRKMIVDEMAVEITAKNSMDEPLPVLSCTKHRGLVDSLSYFNKRIFSENTSPYKIVPRGAFAYATNHIDEGSIGYQDLYDKALISPMYTVFQVDGQLHHGFLYKLLKTEHYRQIFAANTNASVDRRGSLRWTDFKKIEISVPSFEEQAAINEVLSVADQEVTKLMSQLDHLKSEKRVLMTDLLTGRRRVSLAGEEAKIQEPT